MPALDGFPDQGLLQFYFGADDMYGLAYPEKKDGVLNVTGDIHIEWHEDLSNMEEWIMFTSDDETYMIDVPFCYEDWWRDGFKITFAPPRSITPSFDDFRTSDAYRDLRKVLPNDNQFHEYSDKWSKHHPKSTVVGGHPFFSQMDPRYSHAECHDYTVCLLSFDSQNGKLLWGDCGTGSFLITPADLAARRFDRVLSNYDCL